METQVKEAKKFNFQPNEIKEALLLKKFSYNKYILFCFLFAIIVLLIVIYIQYKN